ncbi:MAG: hypothetical protein GY847_04580 [Proteobacteria bacterium]|nr:hypothetical protein [Pseudomonadota bacterium]
MENNEILETWRCLVCYKCMSIIPNNANWGGKKLKYDVNNNIICPLCQRALLSSALSYFNFYCRGLENDFIQWLGYQPWYVQWSRNQALIDKYGSHYRMAHGWEPYFYFIIAAAASGVIGNAAYEALKPLVERFFRRQFQSKTFGLNIEHHVQLVFDYISEKKPLSGSQQDMAYQIKAKVRVDVKAGNEAIHDPDFLSAIKELQEGFRLAISDLDRNQFDQQNQKIVEQLNPADAKKPLR